MKKLLFFLTLSLAMVFTSCSKDEIENTATVSTAGEWYVEVVACDENDNVFREDADLFEIGKWHCLTYNTAANVPTEMIINDLAGFWDYQVPVVVDPATMTFATAGNDWVDNISYECKVKIWGGKIVLNGGKQNNGSVADYIEYNIAFDDDNNAGAYYHHLKVKGVRYSGLEEND